MIPWRSDRLPTPVFLPGESHAPRSLAGFSPRGSKESDMTQQLTHLLPPPPPKLPSTTKAPGRLPDLAQNPGLCSAFSVFLVPAPACLLCCPSVSLSSTVQLLETRQHLRVPLGHQPSAWAPAPPNTTPGILEAPSPPGSSHLQGSTQHGFHRIFWNSLDTWSSIPHSLVRFPRPGELLVLSLCCSLQRQDFKNLFTACPQRTTPGNSSVYCMPTEDSSPELCLLHAHRGQLPGTPLGLAACPCQAAHPPS